MKRTIGKPADRQNHFASREDTFTVRDLPREERPRERLQRFGAEALSAQELLAIILGRGVAGRSVMTITQELLARFGSVQGISAASMEELAGIKGVGRAKAAQIKASFELAKRKDLENPHSEYDIKDPQSIAGMVGATLKDMKKEHFVVIALSTRNKTIHMPYPIVVSTGTLNASLVHPREVFKEAISRSASSVVLAHNHPSGDTEPSEEDLRITRRLAEAGRIVGIEVLDHIIVGRKVRQAEGGTKREYFSFREKGLL
jgi:DNA repair protein RadC